MLAAALAGDGGEEGYEDSQSWYVTVVIALAIGLCMCIHAFFIRKSPSLSQTMGLSDTLIDEMPVDKEQRITKAFFLFVGFLPIYEWAALPEFWRLHNQKTAAYSLMFLIFFGVAVLKFFLIDRLGNGSPLLRDVVDGVFAGRVGGFVANTLGKVFKRWAVVPLLLYSMVSYLEAATTMNALPDVFETWDLYPHVDGRWRGSWHYLMPISLPNALFALVIVMNGMHAVHFILFIYSAYRRAGRIGRYRMPEELWADIGRSDFAVDFPHRKEFEANIVRNLVWQSGADGASQANLTVLAVTSARLVQRTYDDLRLPPSEHMLHDARVVQSADLLDGPCHNVLTATFQETALSSNMLAGTARIIFRIVLDSELRVWLKISMLADAFDELGAGGRQGLVVAILMGLASIALTLPDQWKEACRRTDRYKRFFMPLLSSTLFFMLAFRFVAVYYWCDEHVYNFSTMSCYAEEVPTVLIGIGRLVMFVLADLIFCLKLYGTVRGS